MDKNIEKRVIYFTLLGCVVYCCRYIQKLYMHFSTDRRSQSSEIIRVVAMPPQELS